MASSKNLQSSVAKFTVNLKLTSALDAEIADYLYGFEKGHARSDAIRTIFKVGFNNFVKMQSERDSLKNAISADTLEALLFSVLQQNTVDLQQRMPSSASKSSDDIGENHRNTSSEVNELKAELEKLKSMLESNNNSPKVDNSKVEDIKDSNDTIEKNENNKVTQSQETNRQDEIVAEVEVPEEEVHESIHDILSGSGDESTDLSLIEFEELIDEDDEELDPLSELGSLFSN